MVDAPPTDHQCEQARNLVGMAQVVAVASYNTFSDRIAFLQTVDGRWWDTMATIAGVYLGIRGLIETELSQGAKLCLLEIVTEKLNSWSPEHGKRGIADCQEFFERNIKAMAQRGHDRALIVADAIGLWVVWNVLNRAPDVEDEFVVARAVGVGLLEAFGDWWSDSAVSLS